MTPTSPAPTAAEPSSISKKKKTGLRSSERRRNLRIVSIYFQDRRDIAMIKRVAKQCGMSFTAFVRQGAKLYAQEVEKTGRARAA
jgi:hypothetical protein